MPVGEEVHLYHLQLRRRADDEALRSVSPCLGHAVSRDLVHWEERPPAFAPDPADPLDNLRAWSGCCVWEKGVGHLFYTRVGEASLRDGQGPPRSDIGLATTRDPDCWERHPGNPIIVPDPRWYAQTGNPVPGVRDCRDLLVIRDPSEPGAWLGYYATRVPGEELAETAVIAAVRSRDLIHWEHLPPVFAPGKYAVIEMPEVFELDGRWYLTCLAGNGYGNRGLFSDPNITSGTLFAVSNSPTGPFKELADNVLLGARQGAPGSIRSLIWEGERHLLYTDTGPAEWGGTVSSPKLFATDGERLTMRYSPRIETAVTRTLIRPDALPDFVKEPIWGQQWQVPSVRWQCDTESGEIAGESRTGWGLLPLQLSGEPPASFIFEAAVRVEHGVAAGLAFQVESQNRARIASLDLAEGCLAVEEAIRFDEVERRRTSIAAGTWLRLKVVQRLHHIEVYLNDELRLAFAREHRPGGFGLFVDRARALFRHLSLKTLNVAQPQ